MRNSNEERHQGGIWDINTSLELKGEYRAEIYIKEVAVTAIRLEEACCSFTASQLQIHPYFSCCMITGGFAGGSVGRQSTCNVGITGDMSSIPGLGRSPGGEGMATQPRTLAWRIPSTGAAWWATVHGVAESDRTERLSRQALGLGPTDISLCQQRAPEGRSKRKEGPFLPSNTLWPVGSWGDRSWV